MRPALLDGESVTAALANHARFAPDAVAAFPGTDERITASELDEAATRAAHAFAAQGIGPGEVVGVLVSTTARFLVSVFGVMRAGAAVSVMPVQAGFGDDAGTAARIARIADAADMRHLVIDADYAGVSAELAALRPGLALVDPLATAPGSARDLPSVDPESLAIVQFTSGSTSAPKGVMLPHRTVVAGLRACVVSGAFSPDDVFVQWVPTFHDMGLIGLFSHLLNGADVHVFTPTAFMRRPAHVLEYFAQVRGSVITGPNFSYDYLLDAVKPERVAQLDLSSWRLAFNGAEPVSAATVRRFTEELAPAGLHPSVMYPVYGMAEATLSISYPSPGSSPHVVTVDRDALATESTARLVDASHPAAKEIVSVGRPVEGVSVRIVDREGREVADTCVGEIQISGEPVTPGYYRAADATAAAFDGPWFRTGDLGVRVGDELFVAGRVKEMVIVRGQNFFPDDVESVARTVPGVYRGRCIAFSDQHDDGREFAGVIVEADPRVPSRADLRAEVTRRVQAELELGDLEVYVVDSRWLTRTTSGKWQRALARQRISAQREATTERAEPARASR